MKYFKKMSKKVAQPPGALVHMGDKKTDSVTLNLLSYNEEIFDETIPADTSECLPQKDFKGVCWLNITGLHNTGAIEDIGSRFGLHPLIQEDILNTYHRPKQEDLEDYLFLVLKMFYYDKNRKEIKSEHVSFVLGNGYVLTFQEQEGDVFDAVRERIRKSKGRVRKLGADYLLYALVDAVVDNYFLVLETLGDEIEELEERLLEEPRPETLETVHKLKREMIFLRRAVWPLREVINGLLKTESKLVEKSTAIFFSDVYDHTVQVIETTETFRDMLSGLQELYLSGISNKMNEVMKVLTIIATIFIPMTFIAGIYGMNFEFMPELGIKFGYFIALGAMALIGTGMFMFFRKGGWLD
jgi:magnesium transporter